MMSTRKMHTQARLFVGNLPDEVDEDALRQAFRDFGRVTGATVIRQPQRVLDPHSDTPSLAREPSRGFGFVQFDDLDNAETARMAMNGRLLMDRAIRVDWARPKLHAVAARTVSPPPPPLTRPTANDIVTLIRKIRKMGSARNEPRPNGSAHTSTPDDWPFVDRHGCVSQLFELVFQHWDQLDIYEPKRDKQFNALIGCQAPAGGGKPGVVSGLGGIRGRRASDSNSEG